MAEAAIIEPWDLGFIERQQAAALAGTDPAADSSSGLFNLEGLSLKEARHKIEKELLQYTLEQCQGNIQKVADKLSVG